MNNNNNIKNFLNNKYVSSFIIISLGLYAGLLGPNLPKFMNELFKKPWFKILFLFLFLIIVQQSLEIRKSYAFLIVICFVLTLDYLYLNSIRDDYKKLLEEKETKNKK